MRWDSAQYLRYAKDRLRPALDLLGKVDFDSPGHVVDLGCGPGNVTAALQRRWPTADVLGIDNSPEMLGRAREAAPTCRFEQADIGAWAPTVPPHVLYSNAALQWLGRHDTLFPHLCGLLAPGGVLAASMPAMHAAPMQAIQHAVAAHGPWAPLLTNLTLASPTLEAQQYWVLMRPHVSTLDIWETTYLHALEGEDAVVQWAMGTSLRPFLAPLSPDMQEGFLSAYAAAMRAHYPREADGTTLLPFRRLFIVARR